MSVFRMPTPVKVTGLSSSVTKSFVGGIIPCVKPTDEEVNQALEVLDMTAETVCCAYCGDPSTEWDHLNPLIRDKKPTGYISEIHNLVPACSKCNQSKGGRSWREWIISDAPRSPKTRNVDDLESRILNLEKYEEVFEPVVVDFEKIVGEELWAEHWANYQAVISAMEEAHDTSDKVKRLLANAVMPSSDHKASLQDRTAAKISRRHSSVSDAGFDVEASLKSIGKWFYLQNFDTIYGWRGEDTWGLVNKILEKPNGKGPSGTYTSVSEALRLRNAQATSEALEVLLHSERFMRDHPEAREMIFAILARYPELSDRDG